MTIAEVLRKVDLLKPNRFTKEQKIGWLDDIERQLWFDVVSTHENPMRIMLRSYDVNSDPDTVLIAPPPYDELYTLYLHCQIDMGNMEIGKYNNDRTLFNNALMTFRDYWNRTFIPCNRAKCFIYDDRKRGPRFPYGGRQLHSMGNALDMHEHYGPMPYHDGGIATHGPMPHCGEMTPGVAITPVEPAHCHGHRVPGMMFDAMHGLPPVLMKDVCGDGHKK